MMMQSLSIVKKFPIFRTNQDKLLLLFRSKMDM